MEAFGGHLTDLRYNPNPDRLGDEQAQEIINKYRKVIKDYQMSTEDLEKEYQTVEEVISDYVREEIDKDVEKLGVNRAGYLLYTLKTTRRFINDTL